MFLQVELIIPQESSEVVQKILNEKAAPEFKRVVISLHDILSGEFYAKYIKEGNVMMLSEGRKGIDNVFTLRNGTGPSSTRGKPALNLC